MNEIKAGAKFRGTFELECYRLRDPLTGKRLRDDRGRFLPRQLVWTEEVGNIITNEGLDAILDIMLHAATQITTWYCCLVETDTAPAANMTYAVPVYTESIAYDEGTRPEYVEAASSGQSITNSANKAVFTIDAAKTMYGASVVGGGTDPTVKNNTAGGGTLFCYAKFAASRSVVDDDVINLTYTLTSADDGV